MSAKGKSARKISPIKIISGTVIPGLGIAKKMGFPTINIKINSSLKNYRPRGLLFGIYAVYVMAARKIYPGVLHYGKRMFHRAPVSFEVHCFQLKKNFKAKRVAVFIIKRIRAVKNFATIIALKQRIRRDIAEAKKYFKL